jgi:hypothetical protein
VAEIGEIGCEKAFGNPGRKPRLNGLGINMANIA